MKEMCTIPERLEGLRMDFHFKIIDTWPRLIKVRAMRLTIFKVIYFCSDKGRLQSALWCSFHLG